MNFKLTKITEKFISIMKNTDGILGAWHFGSVSRKMSDEYSDADIVLLVNEGDFNNVAENLEAVLSKVCDKILLCWGEAFNGEEIVNNGYLLASEGEILQFDVFLLNSGRIDDFMCKIHYTDLSQSNIIFDINENVLSLCKSCPHGSLWSDDIKRLTQTYTYHFYMTAKYLIRKDYFKLNRVMRTLFDTHASLLLTLYDAIRWGGIENKLHFIPKDKQEHLKKYSCTEDFSLNRNNLLKSAEWFEQDAAEAVMKQSEDINADNFGSVKNYWIKQTSPS